MASNISVPTYTIQHSGGKSSWQDGEIITANSLNKMQRQIKKNTDGFSNIVQYSNTQPTNEYNQVWIKENKEQNERTVRLAEMDDFDDFTNNVVVVSQEEPNNEINKLWIHTGLDTEVEIPTYDEFVEVKSTLTSSIDYLADSGMKHVYPVWENGRIDDATGENSDSNAHTRSVGYIAKEDLGLWNLQAHSGSLYVYRYNYADGIYTFLGYNQRTSYGDYTNWLKALTGTHFRFDVGLINATPNDWMTICYQSQIGSDINELKESQAKTNIMESNLGYWYQKLIVPASTAHSASQNDISISIKAGKEFCIVCKMNRASRPQIYAYYADGTYERIYINASSTYFSFTVKGTASKDIVGFGVAASGTSSPQRIFEILVFLEGGVSWLFNYGHRTNYYVQMDDGLLCFEEGRARADVDTIHQSIAVFNNQVWEFGEGKAAYNGNEYTLENGHANCCNWGDELHGNYPYLYCPKMTNKEINVFSFDGTGFTLVNTITIQINETGYLNAFIDEKNGFIYGFISSDYLIFFVSDMTGTILETKRLMYKIPTIQNVRLHEGILYVVSGYGNQASPNYLNKITIDGALLGRYQMTGIGEIEGIDFLDNKMILASYYKFYINPVFVPETKFYGYVDQLKATT